MFKTIVFLMTSTMMTSYGLADDFTHTHNYKMAQAEEAIETNPTSLVTCSSLDTSINLQVQMTGPNVAFENRIVRSNTFTDSFGIEFTDNDYERMSPNSRLIIDGKVVASNIGDELRALEFSPQSLSIYINETESTANLARYDVIMWNLNDLGKLSNQE